MDVDSKQSDEGPASTYCNKPEQRKAFPSSERQAVPITKTQLVIIVFGICFLLIARAWDYRFDSYLNRYAYHDLPTDDDHSRGWESQPVGAVKWWSCTGVNDLQGSECGYIVVPKNHLDLQAGTAKIALGRFKAATYPSQGTLLFHPGTPGARGKTFLTRYAHELRLLTGKDYDIVGFDARGTGETEPKVECFANNAPGQEYTTTPHYTHGTFLHNTVLDRGYDFPLNATPHELRQILLPQIMGDDLKYMGTTLVARDIEAIVTTLDGADAPINFVGGSYGSIIGQYLINMFPQRVGRIALYGIFNASAWSSEPSYRSHKQWLASAENVYKLFISECSKAGPAMCPLARTSSEDPTAILLRLENFLNELYYSPMSGPRALSPSIFTAGQAWSRLYAALKHPESWTSLAHSFAGLMDGDATRMIDHISFSKWYFDLEQHAILCNDEPRFTPPTTEELLDGYLDMFHNVSHLVFAAITNGLNAGCQYWPVAPPERFEGPWNHTPKNSVLLVSDVMDPLTPIANSQVLIGLLGNSSRLLVHDSPGHSSAMSSPCIADHVKAYFNDGTLPPEGTVCRPDWSPFLSPDAGSLDDDVDVYWLAQNFDTFSSLLHDSGRGYLGVTR